MSEIVKIAKNYIIPEYIVLMFNVNYRFNVLTILISSQPKVNTPFNRLLPELPPSN